jgi:hypothetical protein
LIVAAKFPKRSDQDHQGMCRTSVSGLGFKKRFFRDPHGGLAEILTCFFRLILWGAPGRLLFELISLSLCFVGFCSFL